MNKKMTAKEFKEVLRKARIKVDYETALLMISNYLYSDYERLKKAGLVSAADYYHEQWTIISEELSKELSKRGI